MITRLIMLAAVCLPLVDCCSDRQYAFAQQVKLEQVKSLVIDGLVDPKIAEDGRLICAIDSKPKVVDVQTAVILDRPPGAKLRDLQVEVLPGLQFIDVEVTDVSTTRSEVKFPAGSKGEFRYRLEIETEKGPLIRRGNLSLTADPFVPIVIDDGSLPPLALQSRKAMAAFVQSMASDMDKAADAVDQGKAKTVLDLATLTASWDIESRNAFKKSMAGPLEPALGKDKLDPSASKYLREVATGFRSVK